MVRTPPSAAAGTVVGKLDGPLKLSGFSRLGLDFRALLAREPGAAVGFRGPPGENLPGTRLQGDLEPGVPGTHPLQRAGAGTAEAQEEALDPLMRSLAGPFIAVPPPGAAEVIPVGSVPAAAGNAVAELTTLEDAVRRVAWGGDRRRGVARIELGGEHAGTAVVVHGEGRSVTLAVHGAAGAATGELAGRLLERLRARGLDVSHVEVP